MTLAFRVSCVVVLAVLSGCTSQLVTPAATTSATPSSVSSSSPTPAASATPSPIPAPTASVLSSSSIYPESVTFISPSVGWVLGLSRCGGALCARLAKTLDAGRTWIGVATNLSGVSPAVQWRLRFADGQDGWISGPFLFATHDAGRSWTRVAFPGEGSPGGSVAALETAGGRVYAEIAEGIDPNTYGPVVLFQSPTNVDSWHPVSGVSTGASGYPGQISLANGVFWVTLQAAIVSTQGNTTVSTLYRSVDGVTWRRESVPCPYETVATAAAATSTRVLVVCAGGAAAGSQFKSAYRSDNAGASYARVTDPPFAGDFQGVAGSPTSVAVVAASGASFIDASFDGGRTWTGTLAFGDGGLGLSDLGFTTATQGVVIHGSIAYPQSLQLLMTRDGGHAWAPVAVTPI
jgi:photosystem II stability/assembly factor-like uncharacterized protein